MTLAPWLCNRQHGRIHDGAIGRIDQRSIEEFVSFWIQRELASIRLRDGVETRLYDRCPPSRGRPAITILRDGAAYFLQFPTLETEFHHCSCVGIARNFGPTPALGRRESCLVTGRFLWARSRECCW